MFSVLWGRCFISLSHYLVTEEEEELYCVARRGGLVAGAGVGTFQKTNAVAGLLVLLLFHSFNVSIAVMWILRRGR